VSCMLLLRNRCGPGLGGSVLQGGGEPCPLCVHMCVDMVHLHLVTVHSGPCEEDGSCMWG
jgi:hypothetical protein